MQENEEEQTTKFKPLFSPNKNQVENEMPQGVEISSQNYGMLENENIEDTVSRPSGNRLPENIKSDIQQEEQEGEGEDEDEDDKQ